MNQTTNSHSPFAERLTPDNAALLLIDHQTGLFTFLTSIEPTVLKNNIIGLAKVGKAFNLPTILTTSWPQGPNGPTMPELVELFPDHEIIDRPYVNFWADPKSVEAVKKTGRKKLIIAGLATEVCVALPAISAVQAGYEVYAVIDASADFNPLIQQVTTLRLASAGVVVTTWVAVLAELAHSTVDNGKYIGSLLKEHVGTYGGAWSNFMATSRTAQEVAAAIGQPAAAGR